jgi:hypothetical protein
MSRLGFEALYATRWTINYAEQSTIMSFGLAMARVVLSGWDKHRQANRII